MEFNQFLQNNALQIGGSILGAAFSLTMLMCCCSRSNKVSVDADDSEYDEVNVDDRNSKLAFMLMMLLLEDKGSNRKYIKMAESIGYDHILGHQIEPVSEIAKED